MRKLDFISRSPQLSIFRESSNKNNLGGVLFLIFIIILILLSIVNISDFVMSERYKFTYTCIKETYDENYLSESNLERYQKLEEDLDFKFSLAKDYSNRPLNSPNFEIKFLNQEPPLDIEINKTITRKTNKFQLVVVYKCDNALDPNKCELREEDKINKDYGRSYFLNMYYKGYKLTHQDPKSPIKKSDQYMKRQIEFLENTNIVYLNWGLIEYEEEKGIFGKSFDRIRKKSNIYYGADFKSVETFTDDGHVSRIMGEHYRVLLLLEIYPDWSQYERYTRKENGILDVFANICALSSTVLNLITLAYGVLYSKNYDNYKIVENILSKKMRININNNRIKDIEDTKIELKNDLIENNDNNNLNDDNDNIDDDNNKNEKKKSINLPIFRFYDFLVHLFYFKCCGHSKKQALIDSYNNIIAKFMTIENIFYNQIRFENLLKDYKWNNPQYDFKEKNEFILELQEK